MEDLDHGVSVAVIGAGWAGLVAAVALAREGVPVSVFEAARHLGGRARTVEIEGKQLDNGQHLLIGAYRETLRLMRAVGAEPEQLLAREPLAIDYPGKFRLRAARLPAPLHLAFGLLGASGASLSERGSALAFMLKMRRRGYRLDEDVSVAELLVRHGQSGALARFLWEPMCISALNTPAASASAQVFLSVLREALDASREASDFLIPRADLGRLFPLPAAKFVVAHGGKLQMGVAVRSLRRGEQGFVLDDRPERYAQLVLAVGPHQLSSMLDAFPELEAMRARIAALAYEPIYTCYLQYPQQVSLPRSMTGFDGGLVQWLFDRGRLGGPAGLLAAVISARGRHQEYAQDELARAIHCELAQHLPGLPKPLWSRIIAEKRATFACRPGLARPANRTAAAGLYLAGDYTASEFPGTLEAAVRSGLEAAKLVLAERSGA